MPAIKKTKIIPYRQEEMYALVNDVARYQEFLPFCTQSRILTETADEVKATLSFARGGLSKSFTTLNRLQPHKMIEIRLVDGPFRHLEGFWQFDTVDALHSSVSLDLEFEFSTRVMGLMFGPFFQQIAALLVDAFCERATAVYDTSS